MSISNFEPKSIVSRKGLIKSTSIVSAGTLCSRLFGFVRDMIIAHMLGTGPKADAFFVALRIPNLFRDIVGEGAANSAVVPVFAEFLRKGDPAQLRRFVSTLFAVSTLVLLMLTFLGILGAPFIVRVIAPGFMDVPGQVNEAVALTRIVFPYLIFIGLAAYSTGILYTFKSYVVPAFSPVLLNLAFIVGAVISSWWLEEPVYGLAVAVVIGGAFQLAVQIDPMRRHGITLEKPSTLSHPGITKIARLLMPRLLGAGIYQFNVFVDTFFASLSSIVGPGGISAIYFANRIIQFPLGVFGISLVSVLLPTLSDLAAHEEMGQFKKTLAFSIKSIFLVMLPMSVFCLVLSEPIIRVIFERGQFGGYSTQITSLALFFYAIGLLSFSGTKVLVTAFHSLQDTKTPVKVAAVSLVLTLVLNSVLIWPLKVSGIALASAITSTVSFYFLFYLLNKRIKGVDDTLRPFVKKIFGAAVVMGVFVFVFWNVLGSVNEVLRLICVGPVGLCVFAGMCYVLQVEHTKDMLKWILRIK